jgi:hypothetical protein
VWKRKEEGDLKKGNMKGKGRKARRKTAKQKREGEKYTEWWRNRGHSRGRRRRQSGGG